MRFLLVTALAVGIFFRLFHADWKLYGGDEVATSSHVSGILQSDFYAFAAEKKTRPLREFERFQWPTPGIAARDVVRVLQIEDPQHPPAFYLSTFAVAKSGLPDSLYARRAVAIFFGLLCLPAAWYLGGSLFVGYRARALLVALIAVSPFHVEYAQQAREYSMWTFFTLAASAMLLRTLRTGRPLDALVYALMVAIGIYTDTFFGFVIAAHVIFLALDRSSIARNRAMVGIAAVVGSATFLPWAINLLHRSNVATTTTGWMLTRLSPPIYAAKFAFNAGAVFFDMDYLSVALAPIALACIAIAIWCVVLVARHAIPRQKLFVGLLGGLPLVVLGGSDIVQHHSVAVGTRYLTPVWIALEIATALGLAWALEHMRPRRVFVRAATIGLVACGFVSIAVSAFGHTWWIANDVPELPAIARVLSLQGSPTILCPDPILALEILPLVAPDRVSYREIGRLDDAILASSPRGFAVVRPGAIAPGTKVSPVEVPAVFPPAHDPFVTALRRLALHTRGIADAGVYELVTRPGENVSASIQTSGRTHEFGS